MAVVGVAIAGNVGIAERGCKKYNRRVSYFIVCRGEKRCAPVVAAAAQRLPAQHCSLNLKIDGRMIIMHEPS